MPGEGKRGRKPGVPNKRSAAMAKAIRESGITPLDYMIKLMRNGRDENTRFEAAKAAAPYVHAKLAAVDATLKANVDGSVTFTWLPTEDKPKA